MAGKRNGPDEDHGRNGFWQAPGHCDPTGRRSGLNGCENHGQCAGERDRPVQGRHVHDGFVKARRMLRSRWCRDLDGRRRAGQDAFPAAVNAALGCARPAVNAPGGSADGDSRR